MCFLIKSVLNYMPLAQDLAKVKLTRMLKHFKIQVSDQK